MNFSGAIRINKCGVIVLFGIVFLLIFYTYNSRSGSSSEFLGESDHSSDGGSGVKNNLKSRRDSDKISLREILIASIDVAERGGLEVVKVRENGPADLGEQLKGKTAEGAKDRVTEGDFNSHRVMYYGIRKAFPKVKVISEEHISNQDWSDVQLPRMLNDEISNLFFKNENQILEADDVTVWIDPLDATQEYTENLLEYVTTMVCVAVSGVPLIGVIHRPFHKETLWSIVDHANSPNLEQLAKSADSTRDDGHHPLRIVVSRSHAGNVRNLTKHLTDVKIIEAAGAGYKILDVINGNADLYLHVTAIKKWDLCAGNAILRGLGGSLTTIAGDQLNYSADTDPKVKGILAYMKKPSHLLEELKKIQIPS